MLSRVAESLYWLGRYHERAENIARLVGVNAVLLLDLPKGLTPGWEPLIDITGARETYADRHADFSERNAVAFLLADVQPGSLLASLRMMRENARTVRDFLPRETWELVNEIYIGARDGLQSGLSKRGRHAYLHAVIRGAHTLTGMLTAAMNHDAGYEFLRLGRVLERADMTARIVDVRTASLIPEESTGLRPFENIQWISVLKSLTAYQMYRRKMHVRVRRADALRFLLLDDEFPRSVYRCLLASEHSLAGLPRAEDAQRGVDRLKRRIQRADVPRLADNPTDLHTFIDEVQRGLGETSDAVAATWFVAAGAATP